MDIIEENGQSLEDIAQDIENAGLKIGTLKSKVNTKEIINKVRLERKDVAWMGIEMKGTNVIVKLVKAAEKRGPLPVDFRTRRRCDRGDRQFQPLFEFRAAAGT